MKKQKSINKYSQIDMLPILFIIFLILVWEMIVKLGMIDPFVLPPPSAVGYALINTFDIMWPHIIVTVYQAIIGFIVAMVLAILIAIVMDSIEIVKRTLYPIIITSQAIPTVTIAPLFAIWFGFGYLPKIIIVVLVCFFPITISLLEGLASVDKELLNLLKSMGASRWDIYKLVKFPAALPNFFSGLKISGTYSIMGSVIGEWVGGNMGLGRYMLRVRQTFANDRVFATIVVIVLLSIGVLKIIQYIEKKAMPWKNSRI